MARSKSMLDLSGFDEMLKKIEAANKSVNHVVDKYAKSSADIMNTEMKSAMSKKKVDSGLISRMPAPRIDWEGNRCNVQVGFSKGPYDAKNISDGYKAIFINFGTEVFGTPRIKPKNFIKLAKNKSKKKIKEEKENIMSEIMRGLE